MCCERLKRLDRLGVSRRKLWGWGRDVFFMVDFGRFSRLSLFIWILWTGNTIRLVFSLLKDFWRSDSIEKDIPWVYI